MLSLGETPLANSLLQPGYEQVGATYPLDLLICNLCYLLQLRQIVDPSMLFSEYVYFSSTSDTMLRHASEIAQTVIRSEALSSKHLVVEVASNDGYLLQFFKQQGVPVLGIEPARNVARFAEAEKGIPTRTDFFTAALAQDLRSEGICANVILGNNVLAHVPDLPDFAEAIRILLHPGGIAQFEFPYAREMVEKTEFDTIYHEHQCYFTLYPLERLFNAHGLEVVNVERVDIHGGTLRVAVAHLGKRPISSAVAKLEQEEQAWGVVTEMPYDGLAAAVPRLKSSLLELLDSLKRDGQRLAAYGAAAKGVTLASYCGIGRQYLEYVVDKSIHKQGQLFPVDGIPIFPPSRLLEDLPDSTLILTWNFAAEIFKQQAAYEAAGGCWVIPLPEPQMVGPSHQIISRRRSAIDVLR